MVPHVCTVLNHVQVFLNVGIFVGGFEFVCNARLLVLDMTIGL